MKRLLILSAILFSAGLAHAGAPAVYRSSFTATADTTKNLCMNRRGFLHGVCVSSATALPSTFIVYATSATAANIIATIDGTKTGCYYFDVVASTPTGLTYSNSATANTTVLYDCY
jgi:hypothetical protein